MARVGPRRLLRVWREATPYVGVSTLRLGTIALTSLLRGLAEAAVLVLIARIALVLADDESRLGVSLGPAGTHRFSIGVALAIAFGLSLAMIALHLATARLSATMSADALRTVRDRLAGAFLRASWSVQADEREGHLQEVMTTHAVHVMGGANRLTTAVVALCNLAALLATAVVVDVRAALILLAAIALLSLALRPLTRLTRRLSGKNREANAFFASQVHQIGTVAQEIKVHNVGDAVLDRMQRSAAAASATTARVMFVSASATGLYQGAAVVVVIAGLALVSFADAASAAALGAVVLLVIRALSYGQQLQGAINGLGEVAPYLRAVRDVEAAYLRAAVESGDRAVPSLENFAFQDVSFTYDGRAEALSQISLRLDAGQVVGIVGPSGSGKSTLVQILLRLREPDLGEYLINGVTARDYRLDEWYDQLALVPQAPRVVEASVADNIRFFREAITDHDVERAARAAHLHDEILALPDRYETVLHGVGGSLSGGQAQRLCLARALVGSPNLIFLDEPTSALDARSEALVQQTLGEIKGRVTLVIIAHRMSTLRLCDRIVVLEDGRLQAFDTPDKLLESDTFYREAFELSRA